jgi:hypothetical protein
VTSLSIRPENREVADVLHVEFERLDDTVTSRAAEGVEPDLL